MVDIHISKDIEASQEKVWDIVSDVDREPEFWHGTKSIKNIKKDGNVVEREVVIAFRNSVCREVVTLDPKKSVNVKITDGPMKGTKNITIIAITDNKTRVDVHWDTKIKGFFGLFTRSISLKGRRMPCREYQKQLLNFLNTPVSALSFHTGQF
jgi:ribosome-associated toxin RatA of RatAB toxin-antitoxin module